MPISMKGDRSAWDDINYPELHSSDLETGIPIHHLPDNASEGDILVWRTDHWELEENVGGSGTVDMTKDAIGYGSSDGFLIGDIEKIYFDSVNKTLIVNGHTLPDTLIPRIIVVGNGVGASLGAMAYGTTSVPGFAGWRARGTESAPTGVEVDDTLLNISVVGYADAAWRGARNFIKAIATETWSATARGAKWLFQTTLNGTNTSVDALELTGTEAIFGVPIVPISMADDDAPINGLYFSTDLGRLVYKHEGAVHELYSDVLESISPSPSFSPSLSASRSNSPSYSPSPSVSKSASASYSPSPSASKSSSSSLSPSPSLSKSASVSVSRSPSLSPSSSASPSLSASTSIPQLIDSYSESNCNTGVPIGFNTYVAIGQSFTGDGLGTLHSCKFWLKKSSSPVGNMVARIYESMDYVINKIPVEPPIATSVAINASTLTTSYQLITFYFYSGNKVSLKNGVVYVITCEYLGDLNIAHLVSVGIDSTSPSHVGNLSGKFDGSSWLPDGLQDVCFYIYED